ncbi:hypothetical protein [Cellulosimicrobium sp. CUA-896]|uniref:hypothetical protein n=1 Tax=Cellulosimicrobium sp. CUA-896 TaxID=1517881 RepID=UPI001300D3EA|nr:hypothetical protein [Cellulosimicrobium sp. CUA-896]
MTQRTEHQSTDRASGGAAPRGGEPVHVVLVPGFWLARGRGTTSSPTSRPPAS